MDGEFGQHPNDPETHESPETNWAWMFGYSYQESLSTDPSTKINLVDVSHTMRGGVRYRVPQAMDIGYTLSYGLTPAESLNVLSHEIRAGYTVSGKHRAWVRYGVTAGFGDFREIYATPPAKTARTKFPTSHVTSISQFKVGPSISSKVRSWLRLSATSSFYFYNQDVPRFVSNLDTPQATRVGLSGFSSTVFGLPLNSSSADISLYLPRDFDVTTGGVYTVNAADQSIQWSEHLEISKAFNEAFTLSLGYERDDAPTYFDNVARLSVELSF